VAKEELAQSLPGSRSWACWRFSLWPLHACLMGAVDP
jgi:hypothetical protein